METTREQEQTRRHGGLRDLYSLVMSFQLNWYWIALILLLDAVLSLVIVKKVAYTEIDWRAYMEEVEGYLGGERDYLRIEGNTGPLVYPAGFLYVFAALRFLTEEGTNILKAQYLFIGFYLVNLLLVLWAYVRSSRVPVLLCFLLVFSKRIHSIFMLRMFNDCIAVLLGYAAIVLFSYKRWRAGSVLYSAAVSIKMNMFLFAPGIFLVYLLELGVAGAVECIAICAMVQLVLGWPFLSTYPLSYISKAFELSRVFMYKWTVNFKFLPEEIFVSKTLSLALLALTAVAYIAFASRWISEIRRGMQTTTNNNGEKGSAQISLLGNRRLSANFITYTILASNMIGIAFARSLHYQFYCWYFHSLPLLLFHTQLPVLLNVAVIAGVEIAFNVFPATWWSSLLLQICHLIILVALYFSSVPRLQGEDLARISSKSK